MLKPRLAVSTCLAGLMVFAAAGAADQPYPYRPIRVISGGGAGGLAAEVIAKGISAPLGQNVVVDNRGSDAILRTALFSKMTPDGYTLLLSGNHWVRPLLVQVPYDSITDLAPISEVGVSPFALFVHPSIPATSVKELIAYAKARPGELNYSLGGIGGIGHLAGELFNSAGGVKTVAVPYKSNSQEIADLLSGRIQITFSTPGTVMQHVKTGKLKVLAVASSGPSILVPGVPTMKETLPGFEALNITAIFAPPNTPRPIMSRLNQEVVRLLDTADAKEKFLAAGIEPVTSTPAEFTALIKSEMAKWRKVIKDANIKVD